MIYPGWSLLRTLGVRALLPCRRACSPSHPSAESFESSIGSINAHAPTAAFTSSTSYVSRGILMESFWLLSLMKPTSTNLDNLSRLPMGASESGIAFLVHEVHKVCERGGVSRGVCRRSLKETHTLLAAKIGPTPVVCAWRPFLISAANVASSVPYVWEVQMCYFL